MQKRLVVAVLFAALVFVTTTSSLGLAQAPPKWANPIYLKAGVIKIADPLAVEVGMAEPGENVFEITLPDIGKFTGHICGGMACGFLLTKEALQKLFPNEIPDRGVLAVSASKAACFLDSIMLITGSRAPLGGGVGDRSEMVIDPSLSADPDETVIIFERKDNGKKVKAVWSKKKMFDALKDPKQFLILKKKVESGKVSPEELKTFGAMAQQIVVALINGKIKPFTIEEVQGG